MTERRMPSGQGPSRGRSGASGRPDRRYRQARPASAAASSRLDAARPGGAVPGRDRDRHDPPRPAARRIRAPRLPRRVSGRAAALGVLLLMLTLAYAYPVRVYLAQQAQIDQLRSAQAAQRARIEGLKEQIARWSDPNYIITQARVRLQLVRKGELLYVVQAEPAPTDQPTTPADSSWSSQLWSNIQGADDPDGP